MRLAKAEKGEKREGKGGETPTKPRREGRPPFARSLVGCFHEKFYLRAVKSAAHYSRFTREGYFPWHRVHWGLLGFFFFLCVCVGVFFFFSSAPLPREPFTKLSLVSPSERGLFRRTTGLLNPKTDPLFVGAIFALTSRHRKITARVSPGPPFSPGKPAAAWTWLSPPPRGCHPLPAAPLVRGCHRHRARTAPPPPWSQHPRGRPRPGVVTGAWMSPRPHGGSVGDCHPALVVVAGGWHPPAVVAQGCRAIPAVATRRWVSPRPPVALLLRGHRPSRVWVALSPSAHRHHLVPWVTTYTWTSPCPRVTSAWTTPHPTVTTDASMSPQPHSHDVCVDVTLSPWLLRAGGRCPVPMSPLRHGQRPVSVAATHTRTWPHPTVTT